MNVKFGLGLEFGLSINCQGVSNIGLGLDYGIIGLHWMQIRTILMESISPSNRKLLVIEMLRLRIRVRKMGQWGSQSG